MYSVVSPVLILKKVHMSSLFTRGVMCIGVVVLSACGGSDPLPAATQTSPVQAAATVHVMSANRAQVASAVSYHDLIQRIYVAYFGRPADPAGLEFWAEKYRLFGLPVRAGEVTKVYASHATVKQFVDFFGASSESAALYPGDNAVFVTAIYRNLFNRSPDPAGLAYWVDVLNRGLMTRPIAALYIMDGAQNTDVDVINKKVAIAKRFTNNLNTPARRTAYVGEAASALARAMLSTVDLATNTATFTGVAATIDTLEHGPGMSSMKAYLGTWSAPCDGRSIERVAISESSTVPDGIELAIATDYYAQLGCSGPIVATETMSARILATHTGRVDSAIVPYEGAPSFPAFVDLASLTLPGHTRSVTGSAVTHTGINGKAQWCINFGGGNSTCIHDDGFIPFQGPISGGFYITADTMYLLSPMGSIYYADAIFKRQ